MAVEGGWVGTSSVSAVHQLSWIVVPVVLACLASSTAARGSVAKVAPLPLATMTFADASSAGAVGAGCTWLGPRDRAGRLAMAGDRAAVKYGSRVVALRPAEDAKPMFVTYDRWIGGGIRVRVRDSGRVVRQAFEASATIASIEVVAEGRTGVWQGVLDCGS